MARKIPWGGPYSGQPHINLLIYQHVRGVTINQIKPKGAQSGRRIWINTVFHRKLPSEPCPEKVPRMRVRTAGLGGSSSVYIARPR